MREEDALLLECLEDADLACKKALQRVQQIRSVHVQKLEQILAELRSERRVFEDISLPARLIVEQLLESQFHVGQVALETEFLRQPFCNVNSVMIEKFGIIRIILGEAEFEWRDDNYSYYFYPDKVELRAKDEKSAIRLFFALSFSRHTFEKFPELLTASNVAYVHPQLETWLEVRSDG